MDEPFKHPHLVFVSGATATGKSSLAISLAETFVGEIISCDSVQVYCDLNIGAAKPSKEELNQVPHHLIDIVPPGEKYTAGEFRRDALKVIEEARQRDLKNLFIAGGTGFYFRALESGMYDIPMVSEEVQLQLEADLEEHGSQNLYLELQTEDPQYAERLSENDAYRIQRALGVMRTTGKKMSEILSDFEREKSRLPYPLTKIGLYCEREALRERVTLRVEQMIDQGLVEEVENLIERGYRDWEPMKSVGYKEVQEHLQGEISISEMKEEIVRNTMRLAKKQMTWFRKESDISWFNIFDDSDKIFSFLKERLQ